MASNSYKNGQTDPLTNALMKRSMKYGPIKHRPRIKFTTPDIEDMSKSEIDELVNARGRGFSPAGGTALSPAEWSAIEARLETLGL
ncbi:MAG: hypothetical protein O7I42_22380 [Alphaproteobacteria bacterium]|nr:hypothetical protein [Alphaproteobacteria bacterium]